MISGGEEKFVLYVCWCVCALLVERIIFKMFEPRKSLDYYVQQIGQIKRSKIKEGHFLNNLLDEIIALDCRLFNSPDSCKVSIG